MCCMQRPKALFKLILLCDNRSLALFSRAPPNVFIFLGLNCSITFEVVSGNWMLREQSWIFTLRLERVGVTET